MDARDAGAAQLSRGIKSIFSPDRNSPCALTRRSPTSANADRNNHNNGNQFARGNDTFFTISKQNCLLDMTLDKPNNDAVVRLDGVSVVFPVYQAGSRSLKKRVLFHSSAGKIGRDARDQVVIEALNDISLSLMVGDRLALIGANGAGKTTLLRTIAGIYEPVRGEVTTHGRISPMLDISLGIDADLDGYDNIRTRALLLGLSPSAIELRLPEIAEFTGLGDYLDMPVRTYSAGMILRLSFAVATCFEPEILLMDESILAGDAHFLSKAEARIQAFIERASVLVLASHNLELSSRWCTKGIWLAQGRIREFGPIDSVITKYTQFVSEG